MVPIPILSMDPAFLHALYRRSLKKVNHEIKNLQVTQVAACMPSGSIAYSCVHHFLCAHTRSLLGKRRTTTMSERDISVYQSLSRHLKFLAVTLVDGTLPPRTSSTVKSAVNCLPRSSQVFHILNISIFSSRSW